MHKRRRFPTVTVVSFSSANACKIRLNQSHVTDIYISWQEKIAVFVPRFWHVCQIGLQYFDQNTRGPYNNNS